MDRRVQNTPENDGELDRHLREWALAAQQHPPRSLQRQKALGRLIPAVMGSKRLVRPRLAGSFSHGLYIDLYNEALMVMQIYICEKVDTYRPEKEVLAWVNYNLKFIFFRVVKAFMASGNGEEPIIKLPSDELERYIPAQETLEDTQLLRHFLEEDPDGLLKSKTLRERPDVSFQDLALMYADGMTYTDIAKNLDIEYQTVCSFFKRSLHKLKPYFYKHLRAI